MLSKRALPALFFLEDGDEWLEANLSATFEGDGLSWNVWFGLATLAIWQARNELIFQGVSFSASMATHRIRAHAVWVKGCQTGNQHLNILGQPRSVGISNQRM